MRRALEGTMGDEAATLLISCLCARAGGQTGRQVGWQCRQAGSWADGDGDDHHET